MGNQLPCPKCGSYNVITASTVFLALGIACGFVGIIIWPLLLLAVAFVALAIMAKVFARGKWAKNSRMCMQCKYKF